MRRFLFPCIVVIFVILLLTTSHNNNVKLSTSNVVSSQLTIYGGNGIVIEQFIKDFSLKYPDISLVYTPYYGVSEQDKLEYLRRMKNHDLPDIILANAVAMKGNSEVNLSDYFLDLSKYEFSVRYKLPVLNSIQQNGKLYFLPGSTQIRGLGYNKTLFKKNGWAIPKDFNEYIELCKTIEATGIRATQWPLLHPDTRTNSLYYLALFDFLTLPTGMKWSEDFKAGNATMTGNWEPVLDTYQQWIDAGIIQPSDLEVQAGLRSFMMANGQCAMEEENTLLEYYMREYGSKDEYGMMPFYGTRDNSDWVIGENSYSIALNKDLADAGREKNLEHALVVLEYMSTKEGQESLIGDTSGAISNLSGVDLSTNPFFNDIRSTLEKNHIVQLPSFPELEHIVPEQLSLFIQGKIDSKEFLAACDTAMQTPAGDTKQEPSLSTATKDFTRLETGQLFANKIRLASDTDILMIPEWSILEGRNQNPIRGRLYKGSFTATDLSLIIPRDNERGLITGTISGSSLLELLTYNNSLNVSKGLTYYISGIKLIYNENANGELELATVLNSDGSTFDTQKNYKIAMPNTTENINHLDSILFDKANITTPLLKILETQLHSVKMVTPPESPITINKSIPY